MNDLIRPTLYDAYHEIIPVDESRKKKLIDVDVVGPVVNQATILQNHAAWRPCSRVILWR